MISCKEYHDIRMKEIKETVSKMENPPKLLIIQVGDNEASNRYVRNKVKDCEKVNIKAEVCKFDESISEEELLIELHYATNLYYPKYDGLILQLPLPKHMDEDFVKSMIPKGIDVDGFVNPKVAPCTPRGIMDWLHYNHIDLDGKNVTIIGRSNLVGKPLAELMLKENATVTLCHSHTSDLSKSCEYADIIVLATGKRKVITPDNWTLGTKPIIIDVGINFDENGKMCGDFGYTDIYKNAEDLIAYNKAEYITPVPKGVGLLTRVALLDNLIDLYKEHIKKS